MKDEAYRRSYYLSQVIRNSWPDPVIEHLFFPFPVVFEVLVALHSVIVSVHQSLQSIFLSTNFLLEFFSGHLADVLDPAKTIRSLPASNVGELLQVRFSRILNFVQFYS